MRTGVVELDFRRYEIETDSRQTADRQQTEITYLYTAVPSC